MNGENVQKVWFVVKPGENILIANSPDLGLYLTDTSGKTLYTFAKDTSGTSACTGACLAKWPAFNANPISAPSVLMPADFSVVTRADGVNQTAYMDRPLYYFAGDAKPGDMNGQGFNNAWYAANISGITPVVTTQPTIVSTTAAPRVPATVVGTDWVKTPFFPDMAMGCFEGFIAPSPSRVKLRIFTDYSEQNPGLLTWFS